MLSFTSITGTVSRVGIQDFLDERTEVLNWFGVMPSTLLILSEKNAFDLSEMLRQRFKNDMTFLLVKVDPMNTDGLINKEVWEFINNPKPSGRW